MDGTTSLSLSLSLTHRTLYSMALHLENSFDGLEAYPLKHHQSAVEDYNSEDLRSTLEEKSSDLFVASNDECNIETFETVEETSSHPLEDMKTTSSSQHENGKSAHMHLVVVHIASLEELRDALVVTIYPSNVFICL